MQLRVLRNGRLGSALTNRSEQDAFGDLARRAAEAADLEAGILRDPHLTERQKQVLIDIYRSFRAEGAATPPAEEADDRKEHP